MNGKRTDSVIASSVFGVCVLYGVMAAKGGGRHAVMLGITTVMMILISAPSMVLLRVGFVWFAAKPATHATTTMMTMTPPLADVK